MTTHPADAPETGSELIGRCYTKARRAPLVHGVIRDINGGRGIRLPGGPYTLTQLAAIVSTFVALILTRAIWGGNGLVDVVVLLGTPFAAAFLLRHLHIDGHNPAAALLSAAVMLTGPRWGRLHGRPFRPAHAAGGDTLITLTSGTAAPAAAPTRPATRPAPPATRATAGPATARHTPATAGAPMSGVQALLARRTASASKEENEEE
ncbi:hypothetical protein OG949_40965 (plasmid) [Streptomyces scopuliridis]|uniref:hypothetical protein n=1 Tax=Streptomyces scopuliridis TaxID=452529 RepID=UPI002DD9FF29|nr:hypothetical protein [Streptomyces scopuliridis]WSB39116.1 hypothetical protein OG949_40965 [Streptomyces scopuliridis]